ncbi:MAG TPA: hypothetical protein PKD86_17025 [Gemmatales bacterium]|nr:hypothetical protein [Gemmatales bacterium]
MPKQPVDPDVVPEAAGDGTIPANPADPLETLTRERDEFRELALRVRADFDNY